MLIAKPVHTKRNTIIISVILTLIAYSNQTAHSQPNTDSVFLFAYSSGNNDYHNGLHFAWSTDKKDWKPVGDEHSFLKSDYGQWGSQKKMMHPYLLPGPDGTWHCVWQLNNQEPIFAHVASNDLIEWGRQTYPMVNESKNCFQPVIYRKDDSYNIIFRNNSHKYFKVNTTDFKNYSKASEVPENQYQDLSSTITLGDRKQTGQIYRVNWPMVDKLIKKAEDSRAKYKLHNEVTKQDPQRFASLKPVSMRLSVESGKAKPISNLLIGAFFEDLNYAADGGLYAELIQNRGFEYTPADKLYRDSNWNAFHSWIFHGDQAGFKIDSVSPVHVNNPHYAVLQTRQPGGTLTNGGYDGIAIRQGEKYNFSAFVKSLDARSSKLRISLVTKNGKRLAQTEIAFSPGAWRKMNAVLHASETVSDAHLEIEPLSSGIVGIDMVSLFPNNSFKKRKNGLRADLAQAIADIHPRFVRFPGGCVAHGDGLHNIYNWKNTIGPLEARKPQRNLWGYHQSMGLGYYEYFQLCEDIGAEPVPVIAAGVPCQNSGGGPRGGGQQGGIPLEEMDEYIQDIIDLIEWANADASTTWGRKRAEAGHPKPFNLKYIGIGNEDLISDVFEERFRMIYNAIKKTHPEITVIGTVGPFWEGTDYREGWKLANNLELPIVDEHYYQSPGWFIHNQLFYDSYDRSKSKVYLGEYAAHLPGRPNNLETALSEALYLTAVERNGDIVSMASYAPLLAKEGHTQWNPNLIYFNNDTVKPTTGYQVQKLYGTNSGDEYLPAIARLSNEEAAVKNRIAYSIVRDSNTGDIIIKLVNMLPVEVKCSIDLMNTTTFNKHAIVTVLTGAPEDRSLKPVSSNIPIENVLSLKLPGYSFSVIRLKK